MAEKERQMNKKVNSLSAKLKTEEEEVCESASGCYGWCVCNTPLLSQDKVHHCSVGESAYHLVHLFTCMLTEI